MVRTIKAGLAFAALAGAFLLQPSLRAQDSMKQDDMKHDDMKHDKMQDDKMMHDAKAKTLQTGKFHGKVHATSGARQSIKSRMGNWCCGSPISRLPTDRMCTGSWWRRRMRWMMPTS